MIDEELKFRYANLPPYPVKTGDLDIHFNIDDVFGYFLTMKDGSTIRIEGLLDVYRNLTDDVEKVERRFFWDSLGELRSWVVLLRCEDGKLRKTEYTDRSRIFQFDMTYLYSINAEYVGTRYGGKRLSNAAHDQKVDMINQAYQSELENWIQKVREHENVDRPCIAVDMVSEFSHQFNRRDASNMIKIPEDALSEILGVNDAYNYSISNRKLFSEDGCEKLYVMVNLINYWL